MTLNLNVRELRIIHDCVQSRKYSIGRLLMGFEKGSTLEVVYLKELAELDELVTTLENKVEIN